MRVGKVLSLLALTVLALLAFHSNPVSACSCLPAHPQTHFCSADYVVIVRVLRKSQRLVPFKIAYKVQIKKSYKMNEDAHEMLKHGRILTANSSAACGVNLELGKLYMIAGRAPYLSLCNYIKEYLDMSLIERRGFAGVYRKGCNCTITPCFGDSCLQSRETTNACKWSPFAKCETEFSACMPSNYTTPEGTISKCHWRRTPMYKACLADP